jgi:NAD(P)-dependent dehydrogenase (short-subunit alcohol dehydrogenase family)
MAPTSFSLAVYCLFALSGPARALDAAAQRALDGRDKLEVAFPRAAARIANFQAEAVDRGKGCAMDLAGRVALVTGAGGARLGRALALALASRGAAVAVHYRKNEAGAAEVVREIEAAGGRALFFQADLRSGDAIRALVRNTVERLGGLDVLVNNAAIFSRCRFEETTDEHWDEALATNLRGPAILCREAARHLGSRGLGKIVNIADTAAFRPWPDYLAYSVSKAGLVALTMGLARALAPRILVNAVAPGPVLMEEGTSAEVIAQATRRIPLGRTGTPSDVVAAVLFLLEGSDYVTGAVLPVDGGRSAV